MSKLTHLDAGAEWLAHHGIEGQKWGVQNGPPYPIEPGDHSAAEKKAKASSYSRNINPVAKRYNDARKRMDTALSNTKKSGWKDEYFKAKKDYERTEKQLNGIKRKDSLTYSKTLEKARAERDNASVSDKKREKAARKVNQLEAGRTYIEKIYLDNAKVSDFSKEDRVAGQKWLNSTNYTRDIKMTTFLGGIIGGTAYTLAARPDFKMELAENRNTRQKYNKLINKTVDRWNEEESDKALSKRESELKRLKSYLNQD